MSDSISKFADELDIDEDELKNIILEVKDEEEKTENVLEKILDKFNIDKSILPNTLKKLDISKEELDKSINELKNRKKIDKKEFNHAFDHLSKETPKILENCTDSPLCNDNIKKYLDKNKDMISSLTEKNSENIINSLSGNGNIEDLANSMTNQIGKVQNNKRFKKGENVKNKNIKKEMRKMKRQYKADNEEISITIINLSKKIKNRKISEEKLAVMLENNILGESTKLTINNDDIEFNIYYGSEGRKNKLASTLFKKPILGLCLIVNNNDVQLNQTNFSNYIQL